MEITKQLLKTNDENLIEYNGADVVFLFKDGLSLIINRLSFSSSKKYLLSRVRILKLS